MKSKPLKNINAPRPIRFDDNDEAMLRHLKELTGLSISSLIRRSVHYAAPRFIDGRVNLLTLQEGSANLERKTNR